MLLLALTTGFERWIGPCNWQGRACAPSCRLRIHLVHNNGQLHWRKVKNVHVCLGLDRTFISFQLNSMGPRSALSSLSTQLADAGTNSPSTRVPEGLHPDEGGIMFPVLWFLFHHLRARGDLYRDPGHRRSNGEMRWRGVVREGQLSRSARYGEIFCSATRRVGDVDGDSNDQHTALCLLLSKFGSRQGEHRDIGFGTKEHMAKVLADINFDKILL